MSYPGPQPWSGQSFDPSTPNPHFNTPQYYAQQAHYQQGQYGQPYSPPINKHVGWHVVNWLFFWPTAIYALVAHMLKIDESQRCGDFAGALEHARKVRTHGIVALCIGLAWIVLWVAFVIVAIAVGPQHCTAYSGGSGYSTNC